jgi:FtsH-binding integral membrane protein
MPNRTLEVAIGVVCLALVAVAGTWSLMEGYWWRGLFLYLGILVCAVSLYRPARTTSQAETPSSTAGIIFWVVTLAINAVLGISTLVDGHLPLGLLIIAGMLACVMNIVRLTRSTSRDDADH